MDAPPPSIAYARSGASPEPEPARLWAWVPWLLALPLVGFAGFEVLQRLSSSRRPLVQVDLLVLQGVWVPAAITAFCLAILAVAVLLARRGPGRWVRRTSALLIAFCLLGPLFTAVLLPSRTVSESHFNPDRRGFTYSPPDQSRFVRVHTYRSPLSQRQFIALGAIAIAGHVTADLVIARALFTSLGRRPHHLLISGLGAAFFLHLAVHELHSVYLLQSAQAEMQVPNHPIWMPTDRFADLWTSRPGPVFATLTTLSTLGSVAGVFWAVLVPFTFLAERTARTNRRFAEYHRPPTSTPAPPPAPTLAPSPVPPTSPSISPPTSRTNPAAR